MIFPRSTVSRSTLFNPALNAQKVKELKRTPSAVIYCEANFGAIDGKTANGLVRHSEKYEILSVIDSEKAGLDTGVVLEGIRNSIPICRDLREALELAGCLPDYFILGKAPSNGMLSSHERGLVLEAIDLGMNIVNGLHEFLSDDPVFLAASLAKNVEILDVRKPRPKKDLRLFSGRIAEVNCPVIAVLGTDCAIGKRTTATIITNSLTDYGINAVMVSTGQTGLIQGARYGLALDAVPSQFCTGELEATILEAYQNELPDVIIVEGQGALSHPAYSTSSFILRGCCPDGVVLQHAPARKYRCDFELMTMPTPASEIELIETFSDTKVIGLTINHENLSSAEVDKAILRYEGELGIPATDALAKSPERLVSMILSAFPKLSRTEKSLLGVSALRLEINLHKIRHNALTLVTRLAKHGISVTGVTKATLGCPEIARVLLEAGVSALGDSRIENLESLRHAKVDSLLTLIRTPMLSQVSKVVRCADISFNTELEVIRSLSSAAKKAKKIHGIVLMVEIGDLREGIMPTDLEAFVSQTLLFPNISLEGIGANLACRSGVIPDKNNMQELSTLADSLEATFGLTFPIISGGNSANLSWVFGNSDIGRVNNLRLGESILLGRETLQRKPINGLYTDAIVLIAEVIEAKTKPSKHWGDCAQTAFGDKAPLSDRGDIEQLIFAIGHQDTDPNGLCPPTGINIIGTSSCHLIADAGNTVVPVGRELSFQLNYSALIRAMNSPFVAKQLYS